LCDVNLTFSVPSVSVKNSTSNIFLATCGQFEIPVLPVYGAYVSIQPGASTKLLLLILFTKLTKPCFHFCLIPVILGTIQFLYSHIKGNVVVVCVNLVHD